MNDFFHNEIHIGDEVVFLDGIHYHGFRTGTVIEIDMARIRVDVGDAVYSVKPDTDAIVINLSVPTISTHDFDRFLDD